MAESSTKYRSTIAAASRFGRSSGEGVEVAVGLACGVGEVGLEVTEPGVARVLDG
jgi:hypothetical protein